ncbi:MAG TPA: hypothetical protein VEA41_09400 [Salinarimonas sp.]|jgi:hypothetical protein|nr:hypothetical protein [Salinarimonas sp.]
MAEGTALRLLCAAAIIGLATAAAGQPRERLGPVQDFDPRHYDEDERPPERDAGQKLCSVYAPNAWRDTIPVPATWSWRDCRDYARLVGATHIHLICVFSRGEPKTSLGGPGELPEPDCGWGRRR